MLPQVLVLYIISWILNHARLLLYPPARVPIPGFSQAATTCSN